MKRCPECGGQDFYYSVNLIRHYKVTPRGGLYTPPERTQGGTPVLHTVFHWQGKTYSLPYRKDHMTRTEFLQLIRAEIERRDGLTPCAERLKTPLSTLTRMLAGQRDGKTSKKLLAAVLKDLDIQAYDDLTTGEILLGEDCELVD